MNTMIFIFKGIQHFKNHLIPPQRNIHPKPCHPIVPCSSTKGKEIERLEVKEDENMESDEESTSSGENSTEESESVVPDKSKNQSFTANSIFFRCCLIFF